MTPVCLGASAYTVGWLCALPESELTAARAMLDEEHLNNDQPPSDTNNYVLGRIGAFNIVIACLPKGEISYHRATAAAARMQATFNLVQFVLMVGVGAGVPDPVHDIRLGDVVVNVSSGNTGGVIHYDMGKALVSGKFLRTGSLNSSHPILKTTLSKLISTHELDGGHGIQKHLDAAVMKHPALAQHFLRKSEWRDVLYQAESEHEHVNESTLWIEVQRRPRETDELIRIHYGVIASGARVIKSGLERDRLSKELGGVLCFEMEAAGLMNEVPCLVIRGICDYADHHKHKQWQKYAAGVAAAYAKELIYALPVTNSNTSDIRLVAMHSGNSRRSPKPHWFVPLSKCTDFVGRGGAIRDLCSKLSPAQGARRFSIFGIGGVGKTQLALEFANSRQRTHPDCHVFCVPAYKAAAFEEAYRQIGHLLLLPGIARDGADVKWVVQEALSSGKFGPWLLIIDNADNVDLLFEQSLDKTSSRSLISYLPQNLEGQILFTTRDRKAAIKLAGSSSNVMHIDMMDHDDAVQILRTRLSDDGLLDTIESTNELLKLLDYLPLAIVQAAAYMSENDVNATEYIDLFNGSEQEWIDILSEDFEDSARYSEGKNAVATTLSISFKQISDRSETGQYPPLAIDYLSFMACVLRQDVPQTMFPPSTSKRESIEALGVLTAYSFVTRQDRSLFSMHRLVHLATRSWLKQTHQLSVWTEKTLQRLSVLIPDGGHQDRDIWTAYLPHALHILASNETDKLNPETMRISDRVGHCLYSNGCYAQSELLHRQTLLGRNEVLGPQNPDTLRTTSRLAKVLAHQGKFEEAEVLHRRSLKIQQEILGPEHSDALHSMRYLGQCLSGLARHQEAEQMHRAAMELNTKVYDAEYPTTLTSMSYVAEALRQQGRPEEAEQMHQKILDMRIKKLGQAIPATLASMSCLGVVQRDLGKFDEAETTQRKVYQLRCEVLGPEHPHTLITRRWLADALSGQSKLEEAIEVNQAVLSSQTQRLGASDPDTILTMTYLARDLYVSGRILDARSRYEEIYGIQSRFLGPDHFLTLQCRDHIQNIDDVLCVNDVPQMKPAERTDTGYISA